MIHPGKNSVRNRLRIIGPHPANDFNLVAKRRVLNLVEPSKFDRLARAVILGLMGGIAVFAICGAILAR